MLPPRQRLRTWHGGCDTTRDAVPFPAVSHVIKRKGDSRCIRNLNRACYSTVRIRKEK
jgi:hypothetical protein